MKATSVMKTHSRGLLVTAGTDELSELLAATTPITSTIMPLII